MSTLLSDRIDFRVKNTTIDKEGHFIMTKQPIYQEDTTILNIYPPNNRASNDVKQELIELQEEASIQLQLRF